MSNARNIANLPNGDDAPIYACRAWVNFRGTSQSGTATASGLVTGLYTATVVTATQFTVEYSGTTYTINTSVNHSIGDGEGVDLTVSGTTVTIDTQIRESGNVSSCQYNGTGDYTVNFATAMPDANYSISGMASRFNILIADVNGFSGTDPTPSSFRIRTYATNFTISNGDFITLAIFR